MAEVENHIEGRGCIWCVRINRIRRVYICRGKEYCVVRVKHSREWERWFYDSNGLEFEILPSHFTSSSLFVFSFCFYVLVSICFVFLCLLISSYQPFCIFLPSCLLVFSVFASVFCLSFFLSGIVSLILIWKFT